MKSFFDFIGRTESKSIGDCPETQKLETPPAEALFASAGGVEVSEFLGGDTRQASRGARRWSWIYKNFIIS
ncbi:hypothetical protein [Mesobacillus jeotgali]|uniref:hypothetical protein n=1 Tax=Mesobacillus jeotgali TaxID=129985 RepID=UPI000C82139B|nr:hypothetical protein [Mesobacillus jeotgali]